MSYFYSPLDREELVVALEEFHLSEVPFYFSSCTYFDSHCKRQASLLVEGQALG